MASYIIKEIMDGAVIIDANLDDNQEHKAMLVYAPTGDAVALRAALDSHVLKLAETVQPPTRAQRDAVEALVGKTYTPVVPTPVVPM